MNNKNQFELMKKIASLSRELDKRGMHNQADIMLKMAQVPASFALTYQQPKPPKVQPTAQQQFQQNQPQQPNQQQQPQQPQQPQQVQQPNQQTQQQQPNQQQGFDLSAGYLRRQQPEVYKNIAQEKFDQYLSSGYPMPQSKMIALQFASQAMQNNMENPNYNNILLNEIKNELGVGMKVPYQPANSLSNMDDPAFAAYYQELQQQKQQEAYSKLNPYQNPNLNNSMLGN